MGASRATERSKGTPEVAARPAVEKVEVPDPLLQLQRCAGNAATGLVVQRVGEGAAGVAPDLAGRIRSSLGHGAPLPDVARRRLEGGLGADLSGVRVHTDGEADRLSRAVRAEAFTTGNDLFFRSGQFAPSSSSGFEMLAHEAAHVVQQRSGPVASSDIGGGLALSHPSDSHERAASSAARQVVSGGHAHVKAGQAPAATVSRSASSGPLTIQRHSSWEHMLIGELKPEELATLGAAYDVNAKYPDAMIEVGKAKIKASDVSHVIQQEINRLKQFQASPLRGAAGDVKTEQARLVEQERQGRARKARDAEENPFASVLAYKEEYNKAWDLKLVAIPCKGYQSYLVTYGELNTMADFFGSVSEMTNFDAKFLDRLIRGVRQSALQQLVKVYMQLNNVKRKEAKQSLGLGSTRFKSAKGKDDAIKMGNGVMDELMLMGSIPLFSRRRVKPLVGKDKRTGYSATLGRNACHFAPESWHSWAEHHEKGLRFADQAHQAEEQNLTKEAEVLANEALLANGFGDHYLQDSYAGGHLINKTQIMAFYAKWLDKQPTMVDFHKNKNWRKVQDMAYGQSGLTAASQYDKGGVGKNRTIQGQQVSSAQSPQAVTNMKGLDWKGKAEALGLELPPSVRPDSASYKLLVAWQTTTANRTFFKQRTMTVKDLKKMATTTGISDQDFQVALSDLIYDGIVRRDSYDVDQRVGTKQDIVDKLKPGTKVTLREAYVPKDTAKFKNAVADPTGQQHADMTMGVVYNEYLEYMNSSFLQKATNALHNHFCENGLKVSSKADEEVFKVYGDDNMIKQGSSKGLIHSGTTAAMSRDAIIAAIEHGRDGVPDALSTQSIAERFPTYVHDKSSGGNKILLSEWHNAGTLQAFCESSIFPQMGKGWGVITSKFAPGVMGSTLGKIDDRPDKRELF